MKKLVFVDSDGTLKNSLGKITDKTKQILLDLSNKGVGVVITTGRPRYHALKVRNESNASRYLISSNGAEVYDIEEDKVIYADYLSKKDVLSVYEIVKRNKCRVVLTIDNVEVVEDEVKNEHQVMLDEDINTFLDHHHVKQIFIRGDEPYYCNKTYTEINKLKNVEIVNESSYFNDSIIERKGIWFSVGNKSVNKGKAIIKLCKYLNVPIKETYGFGNDYNDIEMFSVVKNSIIMENANEDLKKYATIIAKSNDEDGVANFLEELFLKEED